MAARRSNAFDPNIDPELLRTVQAIADAYAPHDVEFISGYRPKNRLAGSEHGKANAIDFNLIDRKTGQPLPNVRDPASAAAYQAFANEWYKSLSPELQAKARWGGYFKTGVPKDWMHLDFGGAQRQAGGNWQEGFRPEVMQELGLSGAGGLGQIDAQMKAAGYTPEQRRAAIASIESAGSGDYGAQGQVVNRQGDRALGKYQVMASNVAPWAEQYLKKTGITTDQFLKDPALQDQLFDAVYGDYVKQYGERGAASKWFTGSPDEPDVTDIGGKLTGKSYADKYMAALGAPPPATDSPSESAWRPGSDAGATAPAPAADADKDKPWWKRALGAMGKSGATNFGDLKQPAIAPVAPNPAAAVTRLQPVSPIDPQSEELKRLQLAQAMAKLNAGKLWG